ncbi:MAG: hypothetical protein ACRDYY_17095, partial [Acidimicrobiales bacterium]
SRCPARTGRAGWPRSAVLFECGLEVPFGPAGGDAFGFAGLGGPASERGLAGGGLVGAVEDDVFDHRGDPSVGGSVDADPDDDRARTAAA